MSSSERAAFRFGIDQEWPGVVGHRPEVERLDERAGAVRARLGRIAALERRPVEGVEREAIVHPALAAEHHPADRQLHQIVEDAPAAVGLPARVALDVPGEAGARRDLVAEAELDARVLRLVRGHFLALGAEAEIERQPVVDRPGVLHEQADVARLDGAFGDHVARDVEVAVRCRARAGRRWRRRCDPRTAGRSAPGCRAARRCACARSAGRP